MPKIIQFPHPGGEHSYDKNNKAFKSWNKKSHRRKFLLADGDYVKGNKQLSGSLVFWGEWEPPSLVEKLEHIKGDFLPKYLHKPVLPKEIPFGHLENTDPYVFENAFKYFVCKQWKVKTKKETSLARLEKGSIILFGNTVGKERKQSFFQLDTVFVISDYIDYDPSDINALNDKRVSKAYKDIVYYRCFRKPQPFSLKLRLYIGATFDNPYNGMYSFSPAKVYQNEKSGFRRVVLKDLDYITNNLNAAPKTTEVTEQEGLSFWETIRAISREQGCVEGFNFKYKTLD